MYTSIVDVRVFIVFFIHHSPFEKNPPTKLDRGTRQLDLERRDFFEEKLGATKTLEESYT